jgi:hypothetical protein
MPRVVLGEGHWCIEVVPFCILFIATPATIALRIFFVIALAVDLFYIVVTIKVLRDSVPWSPSPCGDKYLDTLWWYTLAFVVVSQYGCWAGVGLSVVMLCWGVVGCLLPVTFEHPLPPCAIHLLAIWLFNTVLNLIWLVWIRAFSV